MRHPSPVRWADLAAGKLSPVERHELMSHAAQCPTCEEARRRVDASHEALVVIKKSPAPSLNWDAVFARIHWVLSSEARRRAREATGTKPWTKDETLSWSWKRWAAIAAIPVGVLAMSVGQTQWRSFQGSRDVRSPEIASRGRDVPAPDVSPQRPPLASALEGVVTLTQPGATIDGNAITMDTQVVAGNRIVTTSGRLGIQFDDRSGFLIEPHTTVMVRVFDQAEVAIEVIGTVAVEVAPRKADQRFTVVSGDRRVEVRGTQFRVAEDGRLFDVAVTRGRVAVMEDATVVEVPAGQRLALTADAVLGEAKPRAISPPDMDRLTRDLNLPLLSTWSDPVSARRSSTTLSVGNAKAKRQASAAVLVDGVRLADGEVTVRTTPGRYLVEVGHYRRWVATNPGERVFLSVDLAPTAFRSERAQQFRSQVREYRARLEACARPLRSVDPQFSEAIDIEVGIDAHGAINFVFAAQHGGPTDQRTESCVLDVVRDHFVFPRGAAERIRQPIQF